jgi:lipoprotein NlpI
MQLSAGDKNEAGSLFQSALADCPAGIAEATEIAVARMELKALGSRAGRAAAKPGAEERIAAAAPAEERGAAKPRGEPDVDTTGTIPQRSYDYLNQGDVKHTIAEASRGIRRDPKNAWNYQLRAVAHFTAGAMSQTIEDSTAALRLDPTYTVALRVRGLAQLYAGRPKSAAEDFAQEVRLAPSDAATVILLHVARTRAQQADAQEFRTNLARADRRQWPGPLLDVVTGEKTPQQVGDVAIAAPDEKARAERVCEAQVYLGLLQLGAGDKAEARKLFSAATADCPAGTSAAAELAIAKLELKRIGVGSSAVAATPRATTGTVAEGLPSREAAH